MKVKIGKNTLGDSNKMSLSLKEYGRSTHDLSFAWRSTMGVGTLVPSMKILALPGDTFEINIDSKILTAPTTGPLFGSFKFQTDIFTCPIRLYNALLHNNALNIGLDMKKVKFPIMNNEGNGHLSNYNKTFQYNPTGLVFNLGKKGCATIQERDGGGNGCNLIPYMAYYDIFKNYYANKQEKKYYQFVTKKWASSDILTFGIKRLIISSDPAQNFFTITEEAAQELTNGRAEIENDNSTIVIFLKLDIFEDTKYFTQEKFVANGIRYITYNLTEEGKKAAAGNKLYKQQKDDTYISGRFEYSGLADVLTSEVPSEFDLEEIDTMREYVLSQGSQAITIDPNKQTINELKLLYRLFDENNYKSDNSGLIIKTHMSDIFNNWINTETISGSNGISELTKVNTSKGYFTIDTLNLAKKVYEMLNRIAISGGTYKDWIETVYTTDYYFRAETPVYEGGFSCEIQFEEVVSQSANTETNEPLGTLAGRGISSNEKGGNVVIKVNEPCYIMAISSITPRVDYSMGNDWDLALTNMDDLHKPQLDGIGFQDLSAETMCWGAHRYSIGKQPAWINYMTNYNKTAGKFAVGESQSFMVLNKIYNNGVTEQDDNLKAGFTSYIRPSDFNYIFAETDDASHNFWVQVGFGVKARRVMSAKEIPNP